MEVDPMAFLAVIHSLAVLCCRTVAIYINTPVIEVLKTVWRQTKRIRINVFLKEFEMYLNTISSSVNKKAIKLGYFYFVMTLFG